MKIRFSPVAFAAPMPPASVQGDALIIDGTEYDFSPLSEGDVLPREAVDCPWLVSDVTRENGEITLTLTLPVGPNAPESARFPEPVTAGDGPLDVPAYEEVPE